MSDIVLQKWLINEIKNSEHAVSKTVVVKKCLQKLAVPEHKVWDAIRILVSYNMVIQNKDLELEYYE